MIASALVQNGAKVYIAARKETQLKQVRSTLGILSNQDIAYPASSRQWKNSMLSDLATHSIS